MLFCPQKEGAALIQQSSYETMAFPEEEFPVIFHYDVLRKDTEFFMHWQDNPEFLYFTEGEGEVVSDTQRVRCKPGDIACVNPAHLHSVEPVTPECRYYCLIVEREYLERQGLPVGDIRLKLKVSDSMLREYFDQVVREMLEREPYYKTAAKARILGLVSCLCRHYAENGAVSTPAQNRRLSMVKTAIRYIQEHLSEELSIETISSAAGFSKYYFCRGFKEITGRTVMDYVNFARCSRARRLLITGRYNVTEAAHRSGFENLSYFTRTYKRYMGALPSREDAAANRQR